MKNGCTTTIQAMKEAGQLPRNQQLHLYGKISHSKDEIINKVNRSLDSDMPQLFAESIVKLQNTSRPL
ncbi:hypothetical protein TNCV_3749781 [Trichonephila clavipes]|nr:hypothetical protein TNCV_3749781 [Trichonephila clavipes]